MATVVSKRYDAAVAKIDAEKQYSVEDAITTLKAMPAAKFDESVDLSFRLGVDPKHADQMVRGAVVLPNGIGKTVASPSSPRARRSARRARRARTSWAPRTSWRRSRAASWSSTPPSPPRTSWGR